MTGFPRRPIEGVVALNPLCLREDDEIDIEAIRANVAWLADQGVHGFVQFASMGQMYAPNETEFDRVTDAVVETAAANDVTCVIGAMAQTQREAVRRTTYAEAAGADGVMLSLPYAFPVRDSWAVDFFEAVDDEIEDIAVMVYNYPPLTGVNITADMWEESLLNLDSIQALKESNFSVLHHDDVLYTVRDELNFISPGDSLFWHDSMLGAAGFIGIVTWVAPQVLLEYYRQCEAGNHHDPWTLEANRRITEAIGALTSLPDTPMLPYEGGLLNALVEIGGRPAGPPRKPYQPLSDTGRRALEDAVQPLVEMESELS